MGRCRRQAGLQIAGQHERPRSLRPYIMKPTNCTYEIGEASTIMDAEDLRELELEDACRAHATAQSAYSTRRKISTHLGGRRCRGLEQRLQAGHGDNGAEHGGGGRSARCTARGLVRTRGRLASQGGVQRCSKASGETTGLGGAGRRTWQRGFPPTAFLYAPGTEWPTEPPHRGILQVFLLESRCPHGRTSHGMLRRGCHMHPWPGRPPPTPVEASRRRQNAGKPNDQAEALGSPLSGRPPGERAGAGARGGDGGRERGCTWKLFSKNLAAKRTSPDAIQSRVGENEF